MACNEHLPSPPLPRLAARDSAGHKGTYGSALLIGGSRGLAGSIALSGMAAVVGGAGLVRVATADACLETVAGYSPCFMTVPLACDSAGRIHGADAALEGLCKTASCIAIGPGLGRSISLQNFVTQVVSLADCPVVIDADGLNNLSDSTTLRQLQLLLASKDAVLTPHPGEWARICGIAAEKRSEQCQAAEQFAKATQSVVVLKGERSLITDGKTAVSNLTGTPAMATGGSGDVLTGLVAAAICQGLDCRDAAHLAVHVHGLAGQIAQRETQHFVVPPTRLIEYLPLAMAQSALNRPSEEQ